MAPNPVRIAIFNHLAADAGLTALVGNRIYFGIAPQGATYPLVLFHKHTGRPKWTAAGPPVQDDLWAVKGVASGSSAAASAEGVAAAVDSALNDASLTITGREHLFLLRESDLDYTDNSEGTVYRYCGGLYRLESE